MLHVRDPKSGQPPAHWSGLSSRCRVCCPAPQVTSQSVQSDQSGHEKGSVVVGGVVVVGGAGVVGTVVVGVVVEVVVVVVVVVDVVVVVVGIVVVDVSGIGLVST